MASQFPPNSSKRKRGDSDRTEPPAARLSRPTNDDETALGDDSPDDDSDYGPRAPPPPKTSALCKNEREIALDDSGDDKDDNPSPAPSSAPPPSSSTSPTKRVIGPTLPPQSPTSPARDSPFNPDRASDLPNSNSDSDSDSDYGPTPAPPGSSTRPPGPIPPTTDLSPPSPPAAPSTSRDDWMLAPPSASGPRAPDPTKLRSRKFASGRGPSNTGDGGAAAGGAISHLWTETVEEKRRRLADTVLGRQGRGTGGEAVAEASRPTAGRPEVADGRKAAGRIHAYTKATRGKSLYEEHQARRKKEKKDKETKSGEGGKRAEDQEDDPSERAFDKEKDMAIGPKISDRQRRELVSRAADFGGRFTKGSYL